MTEEEMSQCVAYTRASLATMIDSAARVMLKALKKQTRQGRLSRAYIRIAKLLAGRGYREAQEILSAHFQRKNNLPVGLIGRAKAFRTDNDIPGNSAKRVPRALP
jgi:hypothetical protein